MNPIIEDAAEAIVTVARLERELRAAKARRGVLVKELAVYRREWIIKDAAAREGVTVRQLCGPGRSQLIVAARTRAARKLRDEEGMEWNEIGSMLNRSAQAMIYSYKKDIDRRR